MSGVGKQIAYAPRPSSVNGRTFVYACQAQGGSAAVAGSRNTVVNINIPTQKACYLDTSSSFLRYDIKAIATDGAASPAGKTVALDGHSLSCVSKIEVNHAGALLESVGPGYSVMVGAMMDATVSDGARTGALSCLGGSSHATTRLGRELTTSVSGDPVTTLAAATKKTICTPIVLSSLLNSEADQFLPVGFMGSGGELQLSLSLEDPAQALVAGSGGVHVEYEMSSISYVATFVELEHAADEAVRAQAFAMGGGVCRWSGSSYRIFQTSLAATDTAFSQSLPARFSSLSSIFSTFQPADGQNNGPNKSITNRVLPPGLSINWRIGSTVYPPQKLNTQEEMFAHLARCFNSVSAANHHCSLSHDEYGAEDDGSFLAGLETTMFNGSDALDSGVDTQSSSTLCFEGSLTAFSGGLLVTSACKYDMALVISPEGNSQVVF